MLCNTMLLSNYDSELLDVFMLKELNYSLLACVHTRVFFPEEKNSEEVY